MKNLRQTVSVFLCIIMLVSALSVFVYAASGVVCELEDGCLCVSGNGAMTDTFTGNTDIEEVYIERGVVSVPDGAFSDCVNLQKITMSGSVVSVGSGAFSGCVNLSEAVLSQKIAEFKENVFSGCESLIEIKIPEAVTVIGNGAFNGCAALESLIITQHVSEIEENAFVGCDALEEVYYAGNIHNWQNVIKEDGLISSADVECIAPVITLKQTYSLAKTVLSFVLTGGKINALDFQVAPVGSSSINKIKVAAGLTSTYNKNNGMISLAAGNSILTVGKEITAVTLNVTDCENYSADINFSSCYALIGSYTVNVPVTLEGNPVGGHGGEWNITVNPSQEEDGQAEKQCACCGETVTGSLPFAFKNCSVISDNIVYVSEYGIAQDDFVSEYISYENSSVASHYGDFIGTGSSVSVDYSDGLVLDYTISLRGDADSDGFCDAQDAVIIACIYEGLISQNSLTACEALACDCTENGVIDADDVLFAEQSGLKLI